MASAGIAKPMLAGLTPAPGSGWPAGDWPGQRAGRQVRQPNAIQAEALFTETASAHQHAQLHDTVEDDHHGSKDGSVR